MTSGERLRSLARPKCLFLLLVAFGINSCDVYTPDLRASSSSAPPSTNGGAAGASDSTSAATEIGGTGTVVVPSSMGGRYATETSVGGATQVSGATAGAGGITSGVSSDSSTVGGATAAVETGIPVGGAGAGTGGIGTSGGSAGAGGIGAGGVSSTSTSCSATLIDDLEDGDAAIYTCGDRCGNWFVYAQFPQYSMIDPPVGSPFVPAIVSRSIGGVVKPTNRAASFVRPDADGGGVSGMGLVLKAPGGVQGTVDSSAYSAVRFWYRTEGPGVTTTEVFFQVLLPETVAYGMGAGTCVNNCNDHFSYPLPPAAEWTSIDVPLRNRTAAESGVAQRGFTSSLSNFQKQRVIGMQFNVDAAAGAFKLHVDDLMLVP
ncbi:MAG: hypothetical protein QM784_38775 [Polyangiaceae bacterium]